MLWEKCINYIEDDGSYARYHCCNLKLRVYTTGSGGGISHETYQSAASLRIKPTPTVMV